MIAYEKVTNGKVAVDGACVLVRVVTVEAGRHIRSVFVRLFEKHFGGASVFRKVVGSRVCFDNNITKLNL